MRPARKPRLVIALLIVVFLLMLGIALYAPAFIASSSSQNSGGLTVTPISYIHPNNVQYSITSGGIPQANYTGLFYVQHVCVYHQ
jgi:flagellar basal body-associated protein FliL